MKSILILGAGSGQLPLINLARVMGFRAIVVSPRGDYVGLQYADKVIDEDIRFADRIIANELLSGEEIAAVVSDQLDEAVPTIARLAEHFGVPGNKIDVADRFKNKYLMRAAAERLGINVPRNILVKREEEIADAVLGLNFPVMIKPVDSAASKGVYKAWSVEDLKRRFVDSNKYSLGGVIVEEFVQGREYVVEGFTSHGHTTNLIVGHRDYFNVPGTFIPCATVFRDATSADNLIERRLKEINVRLVQGLGLYFGISHAEFLYNEKDDDIYLVEVAARGGGVCISSDLIPAACGVNAVELYMRAALGAEIPAVKLCKGASAYFCFMLPEGEVASIQGVDNLPNIKGFIRAVLGNVEIGMRILAARDKYSRKGPILVSGQTKDDCYRTIERVKEELKIGVKTSSGDLQYEYWQ